MIDASNYNLGLYIGMAVNVPKKYPKQPFSVKAAREKERKVMTPEEMENMMKRNTAIMKGKINGN